MPPCLGRQPPWPKLKPNSVRQELLLANPWQGCFCRGVDTVTQRCLWHVPGSVESSDMSPTFGTPEGPLQIWAFGPHSQFSCAWGNKLHQDHGLSGLQLIVSRCLPRWCRHLSGATGGLGDWATGRLGNWRVRILFEVRKLSSAPGRRRQRLWCRCRRRLRRQRWRPGRSSGW